MTENENIKALDTLHNRIVNDKEFLAKVNLGELSALFHVKRILECLDAEIERLTEERDFYKAPSSLLAKGIEQIKSEAIKEFAERLKATLNPDCSYDLRKRIDNLVKEMTEVTE